MRDAEGVQTAVRVANGFHSQPEPFTLGLVLVLQTHLRTEFWRAKLVTHLHATLTDVGIACPFLEAKFGYGRSDDVHLGRLTDHPEGGLSQQVAGPTAKLQADLLERLSEIVGGRESGTELDSYENRESREYLPQKSLKVLGVVDVSLHDLVRHLGKILSDHSDQLSSLFVQHGGFSFRFSPSLSDNRNW